LSSADGLPHDHVWAGCQDAAGFLWFGTEGGLARFDGTSFRLFTAEQGLSSTAVLAVLAAHTGDFWVGTDGGVCRLAAPASPGGGQPFRCRRLGPSEGANQARVLFEGPRGTVWVGTADGLYRGRVGTDAPFQRVRLSIPPPAGFGEGYRAIVADGAGGLWLGTTAGVVHLRADGRAVRFPVSPASDDRIFALARDRRGRLWIGHVGDGLFVWMPPRDGSPSGSLVSRVDPSPPRRRDGSLALPERPGETVRWTKAEGLASDWVRMGLLETSDGAFWIGTVGGLSRFRDGRLETFDDANGLPDAAAVPSFEDRSGNLWLVSHRAGVCRLRRGGFVNYSEADGLRGPIIRLLQTGRDGVPHALALGRDGDYFHRWTGRGFASVSPALPRGALMLGWDAGQLGFQDREGAWWFAGQAGVLRYPPTRRVEELALSPPHELSVAGSGGIDVARIYEDRCGNVWVSVFQPPSLGRLEPPAFLPRWFRAAEGAPPAVATAFAEDDAGNVWIGFDDGSLRRWRRGRLETIRASAAPAAGATGPIGSLLEGAGGRLWAAIRGRGVARFDDPAAESPRPAFLTRADGLHTDEVTRLLEDGHGGLYVGSQQGLDRIDLATGAVEHFTTADGLGSNVITAALRDGDGNLWFGTSHGLSRLREEREAAPPPPARVVFTSLARAGEAVGVPPQGAGGLGELVFGPRQNDLEVSYVAPRESEGRRIRYRHRLRSDEPWSAPERARTIHYWRLPAGRYRLEVQALEEGVSSPAPAAALGLHILPPFWQRWWFQGLVLAGLTATLYAVHRLRVGRLLAVERVRARIASDLHDDLGLGLSRVALLSELARQRLGDDAPARGELQAIAGEARDLVEAAGEIVWATDPRRDDLGSLLARLRRLAGDLLEERGMALTWHAPEGERVALSPELRRHVYLVLKEALNNAARHSNAAEVRVELEVGGSTLTARVRDDGQGFSLGGGEGGSGPERLDGRGLRCLGTRGVLLGGRLTVTWGPGAGTTVELVVPLRGGRSAAT
jgi:ligand-binding sensor domain-containing protein/signal transduction histidine kinase